MKSPEDLTFAALADPTRRSIFQQLSREGQQTVNVLTGHSHISQPAVSKHLAVLKRAHLGVPEIVLAGFSFTRQGHSYDALERPRMQIEEDRFVLERLRSEPGLTTSEPELAINVGLRLWTMKAQPLKTNGAV